jgi:hypothetical protein
MLRRISKMSFTVQFMLFLALAALLWIPAFMNPGATIQVGSDGPLYGMVLYWLSGNPVLSVSVAFILVIFSSIFLYFIASSNDLLPRENFLPAILTLIFLSWNPTLQVFHPLLPAMLAVLIAVNMLMKMYGQQEPYRHVFTASMSVAVAALFYVPAMYLLLMIFFSFITHRINTWREWVIALIGLSLPVIYLLSWLYWDDQLHTGIAKILASVENPGIGLVRLSSLEIAWMSISVLILLIALLAVLNVIQDKLISTRRKSFIMNNLTIAAFFMVILTGSPDFYNQQLLLLPLAFFFPAALFLIKKNVFYDLLFTLFLLFLTGIRLLT